MLRNAWRIFIGILKIPLRIGNTYHDKVAIYKKYIGWISICVIENFV